MSRTRRHNVTARRNRVPVALRKHKRRMALSKKGHVGSWNVLFTCGCTEVVPFASSTDIGAVVSNLHTCGLGTCVVDKYIPVK